MMPAYREVFAHGAVHDGDLTPSHDVVRRRMRMHVALVRSERSSTGPNHGPTPVSVHHRRQWQHHPVKLANADAVLHPPRKHTPRRRWTHDAVTIHNTGVKLQPKRTWHISCSSVYRQQCKRDLITTHAACADPEIPDLKTRIY
jgi:hypothetical protein